MAATASAVLRRQVESFTKQVAEIPADRPALEAALTILRDITSSSTNVRGVLPEPDIEEQRIALLTALITGMLPNEES